MTYDEDWPFAAFRDEDSTWASHADQFPLEMSKGDATTLPEEYEVASGAYAHHEVPCHANFELGRCGHAMEGGQTSFEGPRREGGF